MVTWPLALGVAVPGPAPDSGLKPPRVARVDIKAVVPFERVDCRGCHGPWPRVLNRGGVCAGVAITMAVRLNDACDIWQARGGRYTQWPAALLCTARLDRARALADLGPVCQPLTKARIRPAKP